MVWLLSGCFFAPRATPTITTTADTSVETGRTTDTQMSSSTDTSAHDALCNGYAPKTYECTLVQGFSQTRQWFQTGGFETLVDDASWQSRTLSGAGINTWSNLTSAVWTRPIFSPCSVSSAKPDRIVQQVSLGEFDDDPERYRPLIEDTVVNLRRYFPEAQEIVLVPVVGPPLGEVCPATNGKKEVRASFNHQAIVDAIDSVVKEDLGGDLVVGPIPRVPNCECYSDETGHLEACGRDASATYLAECLEKN